MPDTKEIVVKLKLEGGETTESKEPSVDVGSPEGDKTDSKSKSAFKVLSAQALQIGLRELSSWAEYEWNRELILSDDYIGQRNKQIAMQFINTSISEVSSVLSGVALGSAFGPIGSVIGGVIGGISSISSVIRSNLQGMDQQNIALKQMDAQLSYTRQRAGWSLEAASIGEDL